MYFFSCLCWFDMKSCLKRLETILGAHMVLWEFEFQTVPFWGDLNPKNSLFYLCLGDAVMLGYDTPTHIVEAVRNDSRGLSRHSVNLNTLNGCDQSIISRQPFSHMVNHHLETVSKPCRTKQQCG